jgi:hypothetical protein
MAPEAALNEPLVRRVFSLALDRLDAQPAAQRTHSIRVPLDDAMAPEIHQAASLADREVAWASVDGVVAAGWATMGYRLHRRHGAREARQPYLDVRWTDHVEDQIRSSLNRPRKQPSYSARWKALIDSELASLDEASRAQLTASPIAVVGRQVEEVFACFLSVRQMANEPLLLREVSSRAFWGLSKLLDGRGDAVAALLGSDGCPFPEQPIVLNVHIGRHPDRFLFVENHVSFERVKGRGGLERYALIFSSGFRASAARLRRPGGCSVYYTRNTPGQAAETFEAMLFSADDVPTFFWGDLDFSGMAILASLRTIFPSARAWEPGYAPMLERLSRGDGHSPIESGKERQRPVERTGCSYADDVLIPALGATSRFLDQE